MSIAMVRRGTMAGRGIAAPFSPSDIAGLQLWLKADAITGLVDGDPVGTWADSSGNARDATQATAAAKPLYKVSIVNGKPVVRFDGVDDLLTVASFAQPAEWTAFAVAAKVTGTSVDAILNTDNGGGSRHAQQLRFSGNSTVQSIAFNTAPGAFTDGEGGTNTGFQVLSAVRSAAAVQAWVNGTSGGSTATTGTPAAPSVAAWLGMTSGASTSENLTGDIAEILYYNSALSTADRDAVESHLGAKYGIAVV